MPTIDQKRRELFFLERFRRLAPLFPDGHLSQPDPPAPDAVVHGTNGDIGIEITEFLWDATEDRGSRSAAQSNLRQRITKECESLWARRQLPSVEVSVTWAPDKPEAAKRDIVRHAAALVDFVAANLPESEGSSVLIAWPHPAWKVLPSGIDYISVRKLPECWHSYWGPTGGGAVPSIENAAAYLQPLVSAKEGNVPRYRRFCRDLWLLVVVGGSHAGSYLALEEHSEAPTLNSGFDRVFLLALVHQRVLEMPVLPPVAAEPGAASGG